MVGEQGAENIGGVQDVMCAGSGKAEEEVLGNFFIDRWESCETELGLERRSGEDGCGGEAGRQLRVSKLVELNQL